MVGRFNCPAHCDNTRGFIFTVEFLVGSLWVNGNIPIYVHKSFPNVVTDKNRYPIRKTRGDLVLLSPGIGPVRTPVPVPVSQNGRHIREISDIPPRLTSPGL
jgi:hypothetical protein